MNSLRRFASVLPPLALTLVVFAAGADQAVQPLDASPGDLVPRSLVAPPASFAGPVASRDAVAFSWPLDAGAELAEPSPFVAESREYWRTASAAELARGIELPVASPGALVRLNPAGGAGWSEQVAIDPRNLVITLGGESFAGGAAMELLADAEQLAAAGAPFPERTAAFRLRKDLGAGTVGLAAPQLADAVGAYVVHVFEPASSVVLSASTGRAHHLHGETLRLEVALASAGEALAISSARGVVVSPAGRVFDLELAPGAGGVLATLPLDALEAPAEGLWQAEVQAIGRSGELVVERGVRTAFDVALPTARLAGTVAVRGNEKNGVRNLVADLGVETAAAGRYEARGVLYGTDAGGVLRPMGVAHAADWLDAGAGTLTLRFHRKVFAERELGAPFEVRDLELRDQSAMALVERRTRGFAVAD